MRGVDAVGPVCTRGGPAKRALGAWALVLNALLLIGECTPAAAQQGSRVPAADPQQIPRAFEQFDLRLSGSSKPTVTIPSLSQQQPQADRTPIVRLNSVSVRGAHAIDRARIDAVYRPYLGHVISQADLVEIASRISRLYRDAGYHLSRAIVPPQDLEGWTMTFTSGLTPGVTDRTIPTKTATTPPPVAGNASEDGSTISVNGATVGTYPNSGTTPESPNRGVGPTPRPTAPCRRRGPRPGAVPPGSASRGQ